MKKNKIVISIIISIGVILTVVALILNLSIKKEEALSIKTIKDGLPKYRSNRHDEHLSVYVFYVPQWLWYELL